jgi:hypothetical protein
VLEDFRENGSAVICRWLLATPFLLMSQVALCALKKEHPDLPFSTPFYMKMRWQMVRRVEPELETLD